VSEERLGPDGLPSNTGDIEPSELPELCPKCKTPTRGALLREKPHGTVNVHVEVICSFCKAKLVVYPYAPTSDDIARIFKRGRWDPRKSPL
jgi:hypothetical protein